MIRTKSLVKSPLCIWHGHKNDSPIHFLFGHVCKWGTVPVISDWLGTVPVIHDSSVHNTAKCMFIGLFVFKLWRVSLPSPTGVSFLVLMHVVQTQKMQSPANIHMTTVDKILTCWWSGQRLGDFCHVDNHSFYSISFSLHLLGERKAPGKCDAHQNVTHRLLKPHPGSDIKWQYKMLTITHCWADL